MSEPLYKSQFSGEQVDERLVWIEETLQVIDNIKSQIEKIEEQTKEVTGDLTNHNIDIAAHPNLTAKIGEDIGLHNISNLSHVDIREDIDMALALAEGSLRGKAFIDKAELDIWLAIPANIEGLNFGYMFLIGDENEPDYRWDGENAVVAKMPRVNLDDYYNKSQTDIWRTLHLTLQATATELGHMLDAAINGKQHVRKNGTWEEVIVPKKVSELENDSKYLSKEDIGDLDMKDYIKKDDLKAMTEADIEEILNEVFGE